MTKFDLLSAVIGLTAGIGVGGFYSLFNQCRSYRIKWGHWPWEIKK